MKKYLKSILFFYCFVVLASCSNHPTKKEQVKKQPTAYDSLCSPSSDSLFILKNITSSLLKVDSNTLESYVEIDTIQRIQFVTPSIFDESPQVSSVGQTYINDFTDCRFIAKQDTIGDCKPIIISARGDDYHALFLLTLNKKNTLISHILLSGGLDGGPDGELGDSIILLHRRESLLNKDTVLTYVLRIRQPENDSNRLPTIDSISYLRKILPDGNIKIIRTDSSRYYRKINWPNHYW